MGNVNDREIISFFIVSVLYPQQTCVVWMTVWNTWETETIDEIIICKLKLVYSDVNGDSSVVMIHLMLN
jgi:hypothetical protein